MHVKLTVEATPAGGTTRVQATLIDWSGGFTSTVTWEGYLDATNCAGGRSDLFEQQECTCTVQEYPPAPSRSPSPSPSPTYDEDRNEYA